MDLLKEGERLDDLMRGSMRIIQNPSMFCFGTDAVLLADFVKAKPGERMCDLGTGVGILPLLLAGRERNVTIDAVEIQTALCDIAKRNIALNALEECIAVHEMDLRNAADALGEGAYDCVVCNPPYHKAGANIENLRAEVRIARHEVLCNLGDIVSAASRLLRRGGRLCMIYPALRAQEAMERMRGCGLLPRALRAVHYSAKHNAKLVLLEAHKGGGEGLAWLPPLIMRGEDGGETAELRAIYGEGEGT